MLSRAEEESRTIGVLIADDNVSNGVDVVNKDKDDDKVVNNDDVVVVVVVVVVDVVVVVGRGRELDGSVG
eukprot:CAMPEP_0168589116 /NCGR_PEP_ID=MMETSP0420-20121227/5841_1 /TAXON_ID=498008 /ORGANISM="Pessonella sp." /LENGTH=69 /DNA_ID=CAMNT_0008624643 /DNA_START=83 /DNA_END=288 /DNA_ORIENTATION=+